jgi:hypothetical protein
MAIARGLRKTVIETSPPCPCDMNQQPIEAPSHLLILIKAVVEKRAKEAAALRYPKAQSL